MDQDKECPQMSYLHYCDIQKLRDIVITSVEGFFGIGSSIFAISTSAGRKCCCLKIPGFSGEVLIFLNRTTDFIVHGIFMKAVLKSQLNTSRLIFPSWWFAIRVVHAWLNLSWNCCLISNGHVRWCMEYCSASLLVQVLCYSSLPQILQLLTWRPTLLSAWCVVFTGQILSEKEF